MALQFRPKYPKIIELLLYLAHLKPGADKYQAVKLFYLADREHLIRYGRPITFETYWALPYGPVATNALDLLNGRQWAFTAAKIRELPFDTEQVPRPGKNDPMVYLRAPHREVNWDVFSKSDKKVFDEVVAKYGDLDFDALYQITHAHPAYQKAWAKKGAANRYQMSYDDMIESDAHRERLLADIEPIAASM